MTVTAEAERIAPLPRERAFELFIDYPSWHLWMPKSFQPVSGPSRPLREGDRLVVRIPPINARMRIVRVRPNEEVCWGGGGPGVLHAEHSFYFEDEGPGRTRIRSIEPWTGLLTRIGPVAAYLHREANKIGAAQLDGFIRYAQSQS